MQQIMPPKLSILIPAFNVENYIDDFLDSLMPQAASRGVGDLEVIILDDCSTDKTLQLLRRHTEGTSRIEIIELEENYGVSHARNVLLSKAAGQYIWFIDPDDIVNHLAIDAIFLIIAEHEPDLIISDFIIYDEAKREKRRRSGHRGRQGILNFTKANIFADMLYTDKLYVWNKVFKREVADLNEISFPDGKVFEDMSFSMQLAMGSDRIYYTHRRFVMYRRREGSLLKTMSMAKVEDWHSALASLVELMDQHSQLSDGLRLAVKYCTTKNHLEIVDHMFCINDQCALERNEGLEAALNKGSLYGLMIRLMLSLKIKQAHVIWKYRNKPNIKLAMSQLAKVLQN